jgi:hypothetical protein
MADKVAFVYNNSAGSSDDPVAMIILKGGMLRFHAPEGSSYKAKISTLNGNSLSLDEADAEEYFEDYCDRWDGLSSVVATFPLSGRNARKAEVLASKWRG